MNMKGRTLNPKTVKPQNTCHVICPGLTAAVLFVTPAFVSLMALWATRMPTSLEVHGYRNYMWSKKSPNMSYNYGYPTYRYYKGCSRVLLVQPQAPKPQEPPTPTP